MGWGKSFRKIIKKVTNIVKTGAKAFDNLNPINYAMKKATGIGAETVADKYAQAANGMAKTLTPALTAKEKEAEQKAAIAAQETAAKNAADADYYNQIMKSRRQQIADNAGSQTNFTTEEGAFGSFDSANLGGFDPITGAFGRKKKVVR